MSTDRERDDALLADVREVMDRPRAPDAFHRRLHEAVDAGFLDPPRRRRRWPVVLAVAAAAAAVVAAVLVPRLLATRDASSDPDALRMRSADGVPLAVEMSVLAVAEEGSSSAWVHAGDAVASGTWLRFRVEAPPGVHLALVRLGDDVEVFYRWPLEGGTEARVARDGDVWYSVEGVAGEQTFVCVATDRSLDQEQAAHVALGGELAGERTRVLRLPVVVE
jgi:hypothetical protein